MGILLHRDGWTARCCGYSRFRPVSWRGMADGPPPVNFPLLSNAVDMSASRNARPDVDTVLPRLQSPASPFRAIAARSPLFLALALRVRWTRGWLGVGSSRAVFAFQTSRIVATSRVPALRDASLGAMAGFTSSHVALRGIGRGGPRGGALLFRPAKGCESRLGPAVVSRVSPFAEVTV